MGSFHHNTLMVFASVSAYSAPALMTICLLTDYWIYGKQARLSQNPIIKAGDTRVLNFTYHRIGLWRECFKESQDLPYTCEVVKYSKTEAKLEKGFKAVAYRSAPSMACFTAASALLIIAIVLFTRGLCKRRRKAVFFISGLLFSISGLLTMVGVTLYVSITTEESAKIDQDYPVMRCFYGFSFLCAVLSFILQELTGVLTVYWFIYRFRALVRKQEKIRERTRQLMNNCLSMTTSLPLNIATSSPKSHHTKSINQNHSIHPYAPTLLIDNISHEPYILPHSPSTLYKDYCRILIRTEDMDVIAQMVKSKSQAQSLANSRPTTPAPVLTTKISANSHVNRSNHDMTKRRSMKKIIKRTTSV